MHYRFQPRQPTLQSYYLTLTSRSSITNHLHHFDGVLPWCCLIKNVIGLLKYFTTTESSEKKSILTASQVNLNGKS